MSNLNAVQQSVQTTQAVQSEANDLTLAFYVNIANRVKALYEKEEMFRLTCQLGAIAILLIVAIGKAGVNLAIQVWRWGSPVVRSIWSELIEKDKRKALIHRTHEYSQIHRQRVSNAAARVMSTLKPMLQRIQSSSRSILGEQPEQPSAKTSLKKQS